MLPPPWALYCRPLRGVAGCRVAYPGLADSPWATCSRPRGLYTVARCAGSRVVASHTQGSRTRPGLHAPAPYVGSSDDVMLRVDSPPLYAGSKPVVASS